jgi:hypothetical protein
VEFQVNLRLRLLSAAEKLMELVSFRLFCGYFACFYRVSVVCYLPVICRLLFDTYQAFIEISNKLTTSLWLLTNLKPKRKSQRIPMARS